MKLKELTDDQWGYLSTAITADILDNKITLSPKFIKEIFMGKDPVDAEDLLKALVLPNMHWEDYIEKAIEEGEEFYKEFGSKVKQNSSFDKILFCRACDFDGHQNEFDLDEEDPEFIACPECGSLAIGVRRYKEEQEE